MTILNTRPEVDLLTTDEVVDCLSRQPALRRLAIMCVLRAVRVGDGLRFRRSELEAWIREQEIRLPDETASH